MNVSSIVPKYKKGSRVFSSIKPIPFLYKYLSRFFFNYPASLVEKGFLNSQVYSVYAKFLDP